MATAHDFGPSRVPMRKILTAFDGSSHAARAVDLAAELTQRFGGELTIVTVVKDEGSDITPPEVKAYAELEHTDAPTERELVENQARQLLQEAAARAREVGVTGAQTKLVFGPPARKIIDVADDIGADVIVMGSRGLGAVQSALGSVSQRVAHHARASVITVK